MYPIYSDILYGLTGLYIYDSKSVYFDVLNLRWKIINESSKRRVGQENNLLNMIHKIDWICDLNIKQFFVLNQ